MKKILCFAVIIYSLSYTLFAQNIPREYFHKDFSQISKYYCFADSVHSFDALSYEINLQIFPQTHYISGDVIAKIQVIDDDISIIQYELEELIVDSIFVDSDTTYYEYDDEIITIFLDQNYNIGDTITTHVYYKGYPTNSSDVYHTGIYWQSHIFTYSDPNGARYWWPCYDHPWDKATSKLNLRVPEDMLAASNGLLVQEIDNGDGTKTFYWDNSDPIATYLISFCAGEYVIFEQNYPDIPIINYVYPSHLGYAQNDFTCIPTALNAYQNMFGDYPFQKYGMAECGIFTGFGGMEHQTMTSIGNGLIDGLGTYEMIFVHELGHQWFGDCLTPLTWKDVWLSEGFATYSEALFVEYKYGYEEMCDYIETSFHNYYLMWAGNTPYTTYDPPYSSYFTPATYEKPASVLHMIRLMVGDSTFFDILQTYFSTYKNSNVVTTDFMESCENISGVDFQNFFDAWIYGSGIPRFEYYYLKCYSLGDSLLMFKARSISPTDSEFEMMIPLVVSSAGENDTILVKTGAEIFDSTLIPLFSIDLQNIDIEYDPDNWVLDKGSTEILPELEAGYGGDNQVILCLEEFPDTTQYNNWFYRIYRKTSGQSEYIQTDVEFIENTLCCIDNNVQNGVTYDYVCTAYQADTLYDTLETGFSNSVRVTPIEFPLDYGILLVDETRDGSGGPADPFDATVDTFYHEVLQHYNITDFDYESEDSLALDFLAHYSTVIWHDDDFNQHFIENEINKLTSLMLSGGNIAISGWKTADYIPDFFLKNFVGCSEVEINMELDYLGAIPEDEYPYIDVNGSFIPAWNDMWMYVCTFSENKNDNILYKFDSFSGNNTGKIVGITNDINNKNMVVLGFPLYFMEQNNVESYFSKILTDFGEQTGIDNGNSDTADLTQICNQPNPFHKSTKISLNLKKDKIKTVMLKIFNLKGQKIKTFSSKYIQGKSNIDFIWDGKDEKGRKVSSGIYFYKFEYLENVLVSKMLLLD